MGLNMLICLVAIDCGQSYEVRRRDAIASSDQLIQAAKAKCLVGEERLGVGGADARAEIAVDRAYHLGHGGAVADELGFVAGDRFDFAVDRVGDVDAKRGGEIYSQVRAEIVDDSLGIAWRA